MTEKYYFFIRALFSVPSGLEILECFSLNTCLETKESVPSVSVTTVSRLLRSRSPARSLFARFTSRRTQEQPGYTFFSTFQSRVQSCHLSIQKKKKPTTKQNETLWGFPPRSRQREGQPASRSPHSRGVASRRACAAHEGAPRHPR